ncbi:TlpA family protein disulfide reductase [Novosphingobium flavum]|uniref:TlpA family protein disulfide reductase n=1 Tax=Novosphingobium flavum TaxID=1778672 RepID=UPI001FEC829B|nr:TlpA disulfide reductase family protein [Novosphingobium flavum]
MLLSRSLKPAVLGLAALSALNLAGCDRQSGDGAQPAAQASGTTQAADAAPTKGADRSHKGAALPDFTFADPKGGKLALASLGSKPLLINLWATWCAPCIKELPTLDALAKAGKVRVLTVSQDSAEPAKVGQFLTDKGLAKLEPWLDPENQLAFHYMTGTLPTTVLYDSHGREVWRFVGENDWASAEASALIAEAK